MCQGGRIFQQMVKKEYCVGERLRIMKGSFTLQDDMNHNNKSKSKDILQESGNSKSSVVYLSQRSWFIPKASDSTSCLTSRQQFHSNHERRIDEKSLGCIV